MGEAREIADLIVASAGYRLTVGKTDKAKVVAESQGLRRPMPSALLARAAVKAYRLDPPVTPPPAGSSLSAVWQQDAVFTTALSSFNGANRAAAFAHGWKVVYAQLLHAVNGAANEQEMQVFLREGWTIVGWGTYGYDTDPYKDGLAAAAITRRLTALRGWKANGEAWAEREHAWKTAEFLRGWKAGGATVPLGWSVLSSDTASFARAFDYPTALSVTGADIDIQAYGATWPTYTVAAGLGMLDRAQVPRDRVAISMDVIPGGKGPFGDYRTWPGPRRLWVGEWATPDTWKQLAR